MIVGTAMPLTSSHHSCSCGFPQDDELLELDDELLELEDNELLELGEDELDEDELDEDELVGGGELLEDESGGGGGLSDDELLGPDDEELDDEEDDAMDGLRRCSCAYTQTTAPMHRVDHIARGRFNKAPGYPPDTPNRPPVSQA